MLANAKLHPLKFLATCYEDPQQHWYQTLLKLSLITLLSYTHRFGPFSCMFSIENPKTQYIFEKKGEKISSESAMNGRPKITILILMNLAAYVSLKAEEI